MNRVARERIEGSAASAGLKTRAAWLKKQGAKAEIAIAALGILLGFFGYLWWTHNPLAELDEFTGRAERDTRATLGRFVGARAQDEFFEGDGARTLAGSEAEFSLPRGARLVLRASSQVRFQKRPGRRGALGLTVEVGHVDVFSEEEALTLDDVFGRLLLKPRSKLGMTRRGTRLLLDVSLGRVELLGSVGTRVISAGQSIELEMGGIVVEDEGARAVTPPPPPFDAKSTVGLSDLVVRLGESFTVHDPSPPTRLGFLAADCTGALEVNVDKDRQVGSRFAAFPVGVGRHQYRVSCTEPRCTWEGRVDIVHDAGTRPLPSFSARAEVKTDGRRYTLVYQTHLPEVTVRWQNAPVVPHYTLLWNSQAIRVDRAETVVRIPTVRAGTHTLTYIAHGDPERRSRTSTLNLVADMTLVEGEVREPRGDFAPEETISVSGRALPGWTVSLDGTKLELDAIRRFTLEAQPKGTLAVEFSHPERGTHYYLRRPRASSGVQH